MMKKNRTKISGGDALVKSLESNNITTIFGIPGSHNLSIYDAISRSRKLNHILSRHEQGAVFMADGYSRASGLPGVCLTTTGPAALNTLVGIGTSYADSIPVLLIASQNSTELLGKEKGLIHELTNQLDCFKPVTVSAERINKFQLIPEIINTTFTKMLKDRKRPAVIEIPSDTLAFIGEISIPEPFNQKIRVINQKDLEKTIQLINSSKKPVILAGGGVISSNASDVLVKLAETLSAPVFTTVLGKGSISDHHKLSAGSVLLHPQGKKILYDSDLLLAIGTRFTEEETEAWTLKLPNKFIHIDIDEREIGKSYSPTGSIIGDANDVLNSILSKIKTRDTTKFSDRSNEIKNMRESIRKNCIDISPNGIRLIDSIRNGLTDDTILVSDLTLASYWCRRFLDMYLPRTNLYPWGFGTLGYALPAAIGAKAAKPETPVVAIMGDGGFMFNSQELITAVQYDLPIICVIFNDNAYGVLKYQQKSLFNKTIAVDLKNPDFIKMGESFGIHSEKAETFEKLETSLSKAIDMNTTCLIEVTEHVPWPVMHPTPLPSEIN